LVPFEQGVWLVWLQTLQQLPDMTSPPLKSPVTIAGNRAFARSINRAGRVPGGRRGTYTEEETLAPVDLTESGSINAERPKMTGLGLPT
jgi:hypothetical protein